MKLSLVFPAYNEAGSIAKVLEDFGAFCATRNLPHEILVVNDGSRDATSAVVRAVAERYPAIKLIEHSGNLGYGAALRTGWTAATGDYIFFTDSDGQFHAADLEKTLPLIDEQTIILGYRSDRAEGWRRRLNARLWSWAIRLTLGLRVRDVDCAWKIFPRSVVTTTSLTSTGAFISAELLYQAKKQGLRFHEIPVRHWPRQTGTPTGANGKVILRAGRELAAFLRIRFTSAGRSVKP